MILEYKTHFGFEKKTFVVKSIEEALEKMKAFQNDFDTTFKLLDDKGNDITKQLRQ